MANLFEQCDFHVHSCLSPCAAPEMKLRAIIEASADKGVRYLGITDHIAVGTDAGILSQTTRELAAIKSPVRVFLGCEADILDVGRHVVTHEMTSELDYICASANHFHLSSVAKAADESAEELGRHFLRMLKYACSLDFVDFIAHPMYVFPGTFDPTFLETITDEAIIEVLQEAKRHDIAMEISPRALDREQLYFRMRFMFLCKEAGLKFAIGSDAHRLASLGTAQMVAPIVRELDLQDKDIWLPRGAV